jgi:L-arabinokinase
MKAAAAAYSLPLQGVRLAEACQWVENFIASSACGLMDQIAVVLARRNFVVPMLCQPCIVQKPIRIPSAIRFWGIDSGVKRSIASPAYESARAASFMGYKLICEMEGLDTRLDCSGLIPRWTDDRWNGYLAQIPAPLFYSKFEKQLPAHMRGGEYVSLKRVHPDPFTRVAPEVIYPVRACTRYAIEEHQRVNAFLNLLQNPLQFERLGELMYQSHFAYTECGLGHPATDLIVDLVRQEEPRSGLSGARVSGGGAGGTVVVLGRADAGSAIQRVADRFAAQQGYRPHVFDGSSLGADAFGVQVHSV